MSLLQLCIVVIAIHAWFIHTNHQFMWNPHVQGPLLVNVGGGEREHALLYGGEAWSRDHEVSPYQLD